MNPLVGTFDTPFHTAPFSRIENDHFLPAIKEGISQAREEIRNIVESQEKATFSNTIEALERSGQQLDRTSSIFFNLNSAETNSEIQAIAKEISPLLSEFSNDILLNKDLFQKVKFAYENTDWEGLTPEQKTLLDKTYKDFVRNGALLEEEAKQKLREIDIKLSQLSLEFGEHVLAETNKYELILDTEDSLAGLPESAKEMAAHMAKEKGYEGKWLITLDYPSYVPFMTYAENRDLRKKLSFAFSSKAFKGDELDNRETIKQIVKLKHERANILGYPTHAAFVLEERMAGSSEKVMGFLSELQQYARPKAEEEVRDLTTYAEKLDPVERLEKWDFGYYSEKLKKEKYAIDDEVLKPYFQLEKVIDGVFQTANKLYGLSFIENKAIDKYHEEVITYEVKDAQGKHMAIFYADFFPRPGKRGGAWMTAYQGQFKENGKEQRPHVSIVCNFTKPTPTKPSLLTFNEVTTLFHEFGHALHGMLADGQYESLSGTHVYWDFVELPSQILENWCYEKECLDLFAKHYETGETIPEALIQKIKESANFMEGYQTMRQLSFAKLDMAWHGQDPGGVSDVDAFEKEVFKETDILPPVKGTNMSCSFSHIFQGGYSSGYYSYKWAEVLDADAFAYFKEKGIFNQGIADSFKKNILSAGGSEHPMILYKRFRGKEPEVKALLKRSGLIDGN